jgi:hypothetical protein
VKELVVDRRFDWIELARGRQREEAVQRIARAAEQAWYGHPIAPPTADPEPERAISELSAEETLEAMYEGAAAIRLDLVYSPSISGHLRKGWANRLGDINLRAPTAAAEIQLLRNELALYETDWNDELHREIAQIRHGLWRLRELCLRHQQQSRSVGK